MGRAAEMAIVYEKLLNYPIPEVRQTLRWQDVALYNFSIGLGRDPMDEKQLDFLYEPRLKVMPSMPVVLASPGFWSRNADTGIVWQQILHGEQGLVLHAPLPTEGEVVGRSRTTGLVDRGEGKGALMYSEREIRDARTGALLATATSTSFLRGNGGFGGPTAPRPRPPARDELRAAKRGRRRPPRRGDPPPPGPGRRAAGPVGPGAAAGT